MATPLAAALRPQSPVAWDRARHSFLLASQPAALADPTEYYRALGELPPVYWDDSTKVFVATGYAEIAAVLRDHRRFRSSRSHHREDLAGRGMGELEPVLRMLSQQILFLDPPDHTQVRNALKPSFSKSATAAREPVVDRIVADLLDQLPEHGTADIVGEFAGVLPTRLTAMRFGLPDQVERLGVWADAYETLLSSVGSLPHIQDRAVLPVLEEAWTAFRAYASERRNGGDDLISVLANAFAAPGMTEPELNLGLDAVAAHLMVLLVGGYETLTHLIATGLMRLSQHPDQLDRLRNDWSLIDRAIDEIIRLDGSSQFVTRVAAEDTEVAGQRIPRGSAIVLMLAAGNRDPRQFSDPERFDISRAEASHLGFGLGRHHCIGTLDAEQAGRVALTAFLKRYAQFGLAGDFESSVTWGQHPNTRCPTRMMMYLDSESAGPAAYLPPGSTATDRSPVDPASPDLTATASRPAAQPRGAAAVMAPADLALLRMTATPAVSLSDELLWHDAVAAAAARAPDAVALRTASTDIAYGRLIHAADVLAARLRNSGVEPGVVVAVVCDRVPEAYVAALAVGRAGGAFLTADACCPPERLRDMLDEARAAVVCVQPHLVEFARAAAPATATMHALDEAELASAPQPAPPVSGVHPGDPAYVVFTSGSTGRPKAIAVPHEALVNLQVALRHVYRLTPQDRVLQWFSPHFDGWPFDLVTALTAGASLVLPPPTNICVGPELREVLSRHAVTVATLTPTAWRTAPELAGLNHLRLVASAGEVLSGALVDRLATRGRRVLNLYGPAEAAIWSSWHECLPGSGEDPPIGVAIPNRRLYVIDHTGRPAENEAVGELWIAGPGLGRYLHRPDLMQQRFRPDPLAQRPDHLMYATGDLCRRRPDGSLTFVGRTDRQLKIRGQRIEPEEIERALETAPNVEHATVELVDGRLTATLIPVPGTPLEIEALTAHLRTRVHSAMVPVAFTVAARAALSGTGKRQIVADPLSGPPLPQAIPVAPASVSRPLHDESAAPRSIVATEARPSRHGDREHTIVTWQLAKLIANQLDVAAIHVRADSDFFALGGDSLSLAEFLVAVEDRLGAVLKIDEVLMGPTPTQLAALVLQRRRAA